MQLRTDVLAVSPAYYLRLLMSPPDLCVVHGAQYAFAELCSSVDKLKT